MRLATNSNGGKVFTIERTKWLGGQASAKGAKATIVAKYPQERNHYGEVSIEKETRIG